ncbi:MAG: hypothetical protein EKK46_11180 [Rhodocyclaceae bacterium]|nr:MAG: hypothetical protein EKK46_11180 [Rhodocyclaceae bacterium]
MRFSKCLVSLVFIVVGLAARIAVAQTAYTIQELPLYPHQGALLSSAEAINNSGVSVGVTYVSGLDQKGRIWDGANSVNLVFSPDRTIPTAINDSGAVVGFYT